MSDEPHAIESATGPKRPWARVVVAIVVITAAVLGGRHWVWSRSHEATDNAQVAGDVVLVAPLVQGAVKEVLVADNADVKKGQPLVRLDTDQRQAAA